MAKVVCIIAENWKIDAGTCYGVVPKSVWSRYVDVDENNMIPVSSRCLLIKSQGKTILFDTGMGDKQSEKYYSYSHPFNRGGLWKGLEKEGVKPEDITDIIFSHLHWDHVGAVTYYDQNGDLKENFPNARFHCSKAQWESSQNPNYRESKAFFQEDLAPMKEEGRLNLIEDSGMFNDEIEIRLSDGHSLGHIMLIISTEKGKLAYLADFIPTKLNLSPAWIASQDIHPMETLNDKLEFLEEAYKNEYILMFGHDYHHECVRLSKTEKGYQAGKSFLWNDL